MYARVDFALSPPGILRGARCHTLILDDDGLHIFDVGHGWRVSFDPAGALNKLAASSMISRLREKAAARVAEITHDQYRTHAGDKGYRFIPRAELREVAFDPSRLALRLRAAGKRLRFGFEASEAEAATSFAEALPAAR